MYNFIITKSIILAMIVFYLVKLILDLKFKQFIKRNTRFISDDNADILKSIKFKWALDPKQQIFNIDNFEYPNGVDFHKPLVEIKQSTPYKFDIYSNGDLLLTRSCLPRYTYTDWGCSKNPSCINKMEDEFVADNTNKYIIFQCAGNGDIKSTYSCYSNESYPLQIPCGDNNPCYNKDDGFVSAVVGNKTYTYTVCKNGLPVTQYCNKYEEFFNFKSKKCDIAPVQCKNLSPDEHVSFDSENYKIFCQKNEFGYLMVNFKKHNIICKPIVGSCVVGSHDEAVCVPGLWTTSPMYRKCINGIWNYFSCIQESNSENTTSNYNQIITDIWDNLHDGVLFVPPKINHSMFDYKSQSCVQFIYDKHFKKVPLLYVDPIMALDDYILPTFQYDIASKTKEVSEKRFTIHYNDYEETDQQSNKNDVYTDYDIQKCTENYDRYIKKNNEKEFLGVITIAYGNVILSCRYKKPINKLIVDTTINTDYWGRQKHGPASFKNKSGIIHRCNSNQTLYKFILTCVDHVCSRSDYFIPSNYNKDIPSVSLTYDSKRLALCSRSGQNIGIMPLKDHKIIGNLKKYCRNKRKVITHPYLNMIYDCDKKSIVNTISQRDKTLDTFIIDKDSIFKNDINAMHLYFLHGN